MPSIRQHLSTDIALAGLLIGSFVSPCLAQGALSQADSFRPFIPALQTQRVQWSAPLPSGITLEQLMFALRKRELSASHNPECPSLHNKVQRLRRAERRASAEDKPQALQDLAQAQQRQHQLRCPQASKL